jgi:hypothetical protein
VDREARAVSARGSAEPNTANLLTGRYNDYKPLLAIVLAVFGVVVFGALYIPLGRARVVPTETTDAATSA